MMLPLLLSLVVSVTDDPPVKVWLNHDNYFQRGDKARVNVRLADDGYLLVLRTDAEGRVRVLFPLDPAYYDSYYPQYAVNFGYGWGRPYGYRYAALYSTCYDPFFYDPFLCYDPIFSRPYGFYGYGFYGYGYRPYYGGRYSFSNRPRNLFINRVRNGTGVQMYFKDRLGSNAAASGVGPRFRVPDGALVARRRPDATPVRERDAMQRDRGDRVRSEERRVGKE